MGISPICFIDIKRCVSLGTLHSEIIASPNTVFKRGAIISNPGVDWWRAADELVVLDEVTTVSCHCCQRIASGYIAPERQRAERGEAQGQEVEKAQLCQSYGKELVRLTGDGMDLGTHGEEAHGIRNC
nr:hypothetical protein Iba_chr07eCG7320 [Ipomoea batatas]